MKFNTVNLVNNQVLVVGTDKLGAEGKTVLDASQHLAVKQAAAAKLAEQEFEAATNEFYAPLLEAAAKAEQAHAPVEDTEAYDVLAEAVEGVEARPEIRMALTKATRILRLIEAGDIDRLVWVGDELVITAAEEQGFDVIAEDITEEA